MTRRKPSVIIPGRANRHLSIAICRQGHCTSWKVTSSLSADVIFDLDPIRLGIIHTINSHIPNTLHFFRSWHCRHPPRGWCYRQRGKQYCTLTHRHMTRFCTHDVLCCQVYFKVINLNASYSVFFSKREQRKSMVRMYHTVLKTMHSFFIHLTTSENGFRRNGRAHWKQTAAKATKWIKFTLWRWCIVWEHDRRGDGESIVQETSCDELCGSWLPDELSVEECGDKLLTKSRAIATVYFFLSFSLVRYTVSALSDSILTFTRAFFCNSSLMYAHSAIDYNFSFTVCKNV